MEQRPLRLGDIVDDYCPRERRITNHAIVALVEDTIKQTRCTTCEHEHVFKHAREPRRRKKDEPAALYAQVLSGLQKPSTGPDGGGDEDGEPVASEAFEAEANGNAVQAESQIPPHAELEREAGNPAQAEANPAASSAEGQADASESHSAGDADGNQDSDSNEIWPMHRRLIRAQLPRTGNEPPQPRPLPDFTIRQPGARGGSRQWGRGGSSGGGPNGNHAGRGGGQGGGGQRPGRGGRFSPPRPEGPRGGGGRPGGGRGRRSR